MTSHYGVGHRIQRAELHAEDLSAYLEMTRKPHVELYAATEQKDGTTEGKQVRSGLDLKAVGGAKFNETVHFVDCILNDREPWSTLDDAVHTMRLCEAIRRGHKGDIA
jgi:predicted dehydrogenase